MFLQEPRYYVWTEGKGYTTVVLAPACDILVGIRPQEIAEETTVRNLYDVSSSSI